MLKIHYQDDQEELLQACGGVMNTLIESESNVKFASSALIDRDVIDGLMPDKDHFLIHCVAMGDQETYGPNKNGDGWPKQALARRHQTFVTNGHFFREHRNRDPKEKIGDIKYAAYKPVDQGGMGRVELLMWGHKKKAAEEYEKAKAGKELCFSMSARVPEDVCSCCSHRAKRASDYCSHLKHNMLRYIDEFKKYAFAENPEPTFFDNSAVGKPADRTARYLEYRFGKDSDMAKAASSHNQIISGTEWAEYEGLCIPEGYLPEGMEGRMLNKLADAESYIDAAEFGHDKRATFAVGYAHVGLTEDLTPEELDTLAQAKPGTTYRELAKRACVLSFPSFMAHLYGTSAEAQKNSVTLLKAATEHLPSVFNKMLNGDCDSELLGLFKASSEFSSSCDPHQSAVSNCVARAQEKFSIKDASVQRRILSVVDSINTGEYKDMDEESFNDIMNKTAGVDDADASTIALAYGHYQVAALSDIERLNGSGTVDELETTLIAGNNRRMLFR